MVFLLFGTVFYLRSDASSPPRPDTFQTGDFLSGGKWEGLSLGSMGSSLKVDSVPLNSNSKTAYYGVATFCSSPYSAQSCPSDTWRISISGYEDSPANDAYIRYMIYVWNTANDTIGDTIVNPTSFPTELPTTKSYNSYQSLGNPFILNDGDKICIDIEIDARSPGNPGRFVKIFYGNNSDTSKVYTPIQLLSVNAIEMQAIQEGYFVFLTFSGSENSTGKYWRIFRSKNNTDWEFVDSIQIKGRMMHSYFDRNIKFSGTYYYLLKNENDEKIGWSKCVFVMDENEELLRLESNTVKNEISFIVTSYDENIVSFKIMNIAGSVVKEKEINVRQGIRKYNIDLDNIERGIYFIKCSINGKVQIRKFLKI